MTYIHFQEHMLIAFQAITECYLHVAINAIVSTHHDTALGTPARRLYVFVVSLLWKWLFIASSYYSI